MLAILFSSHTWSQRALCFLCFRFRLAALGLLLFGGIARPIQTVMERAGPLFEVRAADGATFRGTLEALSADWSVRLHSMPGKRLAGKEVITLRQMGKLLPAMPLGPQIILSNGDRILGTVQQLDGERIDFQMGLGADQRVQLPLSAVTVIWLANSNTGGSPEKLRRRLAAEKRNQDLVLLRNGDVITGVLTELNPKTARIQVPKQMLTVNCERITAIALNTELADTLKAKGTYGRLVLGNGCRLSLATTACTDGKTLTGMTLWEQKVSLPITDVVSMDIDQGRAVYLADLKPVQFEFTPYLDVSQPYVVNGSVSGHDLHLGGNTYDKGLGVHSASRLTYDLKGSYRRFEALVGLDDETGQKGSVRIQILLDGEPSHGEWTKELTAHTGPIPIRIDVSGIQKLTLVVDFGDLGDIQDDVDWVEARLIK